MSAVLTTKAADRVNVAVTVKELDVFRSLLEGLHEKDKDRGALVRFIGKVERAQERKLAKRNATFTVWDFISVLRFHLGDRLAVPPAAEGVGALPWAAPLTGRLVRDGIGPMEAAKIAEYISSYPRTVEISFCVWKATEILHAANLGRRGSELLPRGEISRINRTDRGDLVGAPPGLNDEDTP